MPARKSNTESRRKLEEKLGKDRLNKSLKNLLKTFVAYPEFTRKHAFRVVSKRKQLVEFYSRYMKLRAGFSDEVRVLKLNKTTLVDFPTSFSKPHIAVLNALGRVFDVIVVWDLIVDEFNTTHKTFLLVGFSTDVELVQGIYNKYLTREAQHRNTYRKLYTSCKRGYSKAKFKKLGLQKYASSPVKWILAYKYISEIQQLLELNNYSHRKGPKLNKLTLSIAKTKVVKFTKDKEGLYWYDFKGSNYRMVLYKQIKTIPDESKKLLRLPSKAICYRFFPPRYRKPEANNQKSRRIKKASEYLRKIKNGEIPD